MKNKNGITLIALIITIIVMLILVAVTINVALNGGLFKNASKAAKEHERAQIEEIVIFSYAYKELASSEQVYIDLDMEKTASQVYENLNSSGFKLKNDNGQYLSSSGELLNNNIIKLNIEGKRAEYVGTINGHGLVDGIKFADNSSNGGSSQVPTNSNFDINISFKSSTDSGTRIQVEASDITQLCQINSKKEAYEFLCNLLGITDPNATPRDIVVTLANMNLNEGDEPKDYDEIKAMIESELEITVKDEETALKALLMGKDYNKTDIVEYVSQIAPYTYTAKSKVLRIDGKEVSDVEWSGNRATFILPEYKDCVIELELDGKIGKKSFTEDIIGSNEIMMGDFRYVFDSSNKTAIVKGLSWTGSDKISNGPTELTIPDTVKYYNNENYTIKEIGWSAFSNHSNLILTSLPSGITSIGNDAFYYCTNLALTTLPENLTTIGSQAFRNCTNLELESIPESVTTIEGGAFEGCSKLALKSLPEGLELLGGSAFRSCSKLALTSLPEGLTTIYDRTFEDCEDLALTSFPASITTIGEYAFEGSGIAVTSMPGVTSIGRQAFAWCQNLTSIKLPGYVTFIDYEAFGNCANLQKIEIYATTDSRLIEPFEETPVTIYVPNLNGFNDIHTTGTGFWYRIESGQVRWGEQMPE